MSPKKWEIKNLREDEKENHIFIYDSFIWELSDNRVCRNQMITELGQLYDEIRGFRHEKENLKIYKKYSEKNKEIKAYVDIEH